MSLKRMIREKKYLKNGKRERREKIEETREREKSADIYFQNLMPALEKFNFSKWKQIFKVFNVKKIMKKGLCVHKHNSLN